VSTLKKSPAVEEQESAFRQGFGNRDPEPVKSVADHYSFHYRLFRSLKLRIEGRKLFTHPGGSPVRAGYACPEGGEEVSDRINGHYLRISETGK
jgi:hypothetical protein